MICTDCPISKKCGGMESEGQGAFMCSTICGTTCRDNAQGRCPYACPKNPEYFLRECWSVKKLDYTAQTTVLAPLINDPPLYIPQIHHGYRRANRLNPPDGFTALALVDIFTYMQKGERSPESLRQKFMLSPATKVIALGIADDPYLESWWGDFDQKAALLRELGIVAITTPNFSIFDGVPRSQNLINIARIHHFNERLSIAGLHVIPHLYAQTQVDWERWSGFLRDQPHIKYVAMEFQTGLLKRSRASDYIDRLEKLQTAIGRGLHLFAAGGGQHIEALEAAFQDRFTIVDSTPFMKAMYRRGTNLLDPMNRAWIRRHTLQGDHLDELLSENLRVYASRLRRRLKRQRPLMSLAA
jgi:hypothetical protein